MNRGNSIILKIKPTPTSTKRKCRMNLQRGNTLCVMGTVAHHRKLEEIYNLGTISTQED